MTASSDAPAGVPLWFSATFSVDARLLEPAREIAIKVATSLGFQTRDAAEIGSTVVDAMSRGLKQAAHEHTGSIQLTFRTEGDRFDVTIVGDGATYGRVTKPLPSKV